MSRAGAVMGSIQDMLCLSADMIVLGEAAEGVEGVDLSDGLRIPVLALACSCAIMAQMWQICRGLKLSGVAMHRSAVSGVRAAQPPLWIAAVMC